jgi:hypothetical protein
MPETSGTRRPIRSITYIETNTPATEPATTLVRSDQPVATTLRAGEQQRPGQDVGEAGNRGADLQAGTGDQAAESTSTA